MREGQSFPHSKKMTVETDGGGGKGVQIIKVRNISTHTKLRTCSSAFGVYRGRKKRELFFFEVHLRHGNTFPIQPALVCVHGKKAAAKKWHNTEEDHQFIFHQRFHDHQLGANLGVRGNRCVGECDSSGFRESIPAFYKPSEQEPFDDEDDGNDDNDSVVENSAGAVSQVIHILFLHDTAASLQDFSNRSQRR